MRFPRQTKIFRGQLDAAPFVGVFFLLIIFLLLNSSLVFTPGVPIQLPESAELPGTDAPTVIVAVDGNGQFYFDHQIIGEQALEAKLRAAVATAGEPVTLVVQADRIVTMEKWIRLGLIAEAAGIKTTLLATRSVPATAPVAEPR